MRPRGLWSHHALHVLALDPDTQLPLCPFHTGSPLPRLSPRPTHCPSPPPPSLQLLPHKASLCPWHVPHSPAHGVTSPENRHLVWLVVTWYGKNGRRRSVHCRLQGTEPTALGPAPSSPSAPLPSLCSAAHSPAEVQHRAALASRLQGESVCWQGWRRGEAGVGGRCAHSSQMGWQIHRALYPSGQCSASRGPAGVGERPVRV